MTRVHRLLAVTAATIVLTVAPGSAQEVCIAFAPPGTIENPDSGFRCGAVEDLRAEFGSMGDAILGLFGNFFDRANPGEFEVYQIELRLGSTITGKLALLLPAVVGVESGAAGGVKVILRRRPDAAGSR